MTFSEYMKIYTKFEDAHALFRAWADGREAIEELLKEVSEEDAHSQGQKIISQLREVLSGIEDYCKVLRDDMKKAEDALGTDGAKQLRESPTFNTDFYLWRHGDYDYEYDEAVSKSDYPLMPVECDIRPGERIWPEEKFDFVELGMGI